MKVQKIFLSVLLGMSMSMSVFAEVCSQNSDRVRALVANHRPVTWNGQWVTTVPLKMSVCGTNAGCDVPAGPIWNNDFAKQRCPGVVREFASRFRSQGQGPTIAKPAQFNTQFPVNQQVPQNQ